MLATPGGPSTARTDDPTGWTMRQQLRSILGGAATNQPKLFEMDLTTDDGDCKGIDEEKRNSLSTTRLECGSTVRARRDRTRSAVSILRYHTIPF